MATSTLYICIWLVSERSSCPSLSTQQHPHGGNTFVSAGAGRGLRQRQGIVRNAWVR